MDIVKLRVVEFGFHVSETYLQQYWDNHSQTFDDIISSLKNSDIRKNSVCEPFLPDNVNSSDGQLVGAHVAQVLSVHNISQPSHIQSDYSSGCTLQVKLTDGHTKATAICLTQIPHITTATLPGVKLRLKDNVKYINGRIILTDRNCEYIGGNVAQLIEAWKANKYALQLRKIGGTAGNGGAAPKFDFVLSQDTHFNTKNTANPPSLSDTAPQKQAPASKKPEAKSIKDLRVSDESFDNHETIRPDIGAAGGRGGSSRKAERGAGAAGRGSRPAAAADHISIAHQQQQVPLRSSAIHSEVHSVARSASASAAVTASGEEAVATPAFKPRQVFAGTAAATRMIIAALGSSKSDTRGRKHAEDIGAKGTQTTAADILRPQQISLGPQALPTPQVHNNNMNWPDLPAPPPPPNRSIAVPKDSLTNNKEAKSGPPSHFRDSGQIAKLSYATTISKAPEQAAVVNTASCTPGPSLMDYVVKKKNTGNSNRQLKTSLAWSCPSCTFENHSDLKSCEMCNTKRP